MSEQRYVQQLNAGRKSMLSEALNDNAALLEGGVGRALQEEWGLSVSNVQRYRPKFFLLLDLDQTLILTHRQHDKQMELNSAPRAAFVPHFRVTWTTATGQQWSEEVAIRAAAAEFLHRLSGLYRVYIVTTGELGYARAVVREANKLHWKPPQQPAVHGNPPSQSHLTHHQLPSASSSVPRSYIAEEDVFSARYTDGTEGYMPKHFKQALPFCELIDDSKEPCGVVLAVDDNRHVWAKSCHRSVYHISPSSSQSTAAFHHAERTQQSARQTNDHTHRPIGESTVAFRAHRPTPPINTQSGINGVQLQYSLPTSPSSPLHSPASSPRHLSSPISPISPSLVTSHPPSDQKHENEHAETVLDAVDSSLLRCSRVLIRAHGEAVHKLRTAMLRQLYHRIAERWVQHLRAAGSELSDAERRDNIEAIKLTFNEQDRQSSLFCHIADLANTWSQPSSLCYDCSGQSRYRIPVRSLLTDPRQITNWLKDHVRLSASDVEDAVSTHVKLWQCLTDAGRR